MALLRLRAYKAVPGQYYGTPKEVWGFRLKPGRGRPAAIARAFIAANASTLGLDGIRRRLRLSRIIQSAGARHVIFQQRHDGLRVHRAYVTVHMDRRNRVYMAKNRAVPSHLLPEKTRYKVTTRRAIRRAIRSLSARTTDTKVLGTERMWLPVEDTLRPAVRVRVQRLEPREEWLIYVDGLNGKILSKYDNLALATGRARVFDPNPVIALGDWKPLVKNGRQRRPPPAAYARVRLGGLEGTGYLDGRRVTTRPTKRRVRRTDHRFLFTSIQPGFDEVMVYYHVDRAIRYLETLGYRGRRAIFTAPVPIDAHGTPDDNSWYSPGLRRLTFGTGGVDDAEDAEIILHEFGHALQDAICPDFGQSDEAAAMGEGFGDYFAASFFAGKKPARYRPTVGTWDAIAGGDGDPPCLRRTDEALTFEGFDHSPEADEHENGKIWSATLWEIWLALGRAVADRIVVESHFQLDGFTRFARGARAIIDADRNLFAGRHVAALRDIFRRRGIGPVE
ncbi:MAG: M36 family metallopeptidase [Armatimonadota bacterium]|nr:M36 family metallopeptidase [Armatimonadota bacterium]